MKPSNFSNLRPPLFFLRLASSDPHQKSNDVVKPFFTGNNSLNLKNERSNSIEKNRNKNRNIFFTVYCAFCSSKYVNVNFKRHPGVPRPPIPRLLVFCFLLFFFQSDRPTQHQETHSTLNEKKKRLMALISNGLMKKETSLRGFRLHLSPGLHVTAKLAVFRCLQKTAKIERLAIFWKLVAKIAKNRKSDDFSCYLRIAVLCHVNVHFSKSKAGCRIYQICNKSENFPLYLPLASPCQCNLSISSRKSRRSSLNKSYVI